MLDDVGHMCDALSGEIGLFVKRLGRYPESIVLPGTLVSFLVHVSRLFMEETTCDEQVAGWCEIIDVLELNLASNGAVAENVVINNITELWRETTEGALGLQVHGRSIVASRRIGAVCNEMCVVVAAGKH